VSTEIDGLPSTHTDLDRDLCHPSIAHAAFYGVGAYVAALMALNLHSPFLVNLICAIILSALVGALVGIPSLRIRDDYFVIATFAFQVITFSILNNWVTFTGGPMGLPGIPQPTLFGLEISSNFRFLLLVGFSCAVALLVTRRIVQSPFGRVLKAIREDEVFTEAAGKNIAAYKVLVFVIGAGMAAVAGSSIQPASRLWNRSSSFPLSSSAVLEAYGDLS